MAGNQTLGADTSRATLDGAKVPESDKREEIFIGRCVELAKKAGDASYKSHEMEEALAELAAVGREDPFLLLRTLKEGRFNAPSTDWLENYQQAILEAVGRIKEPRTIRDILDIVDDRNFHTGVREKAIEAVGMMDGEAAVEPLWKILVNNEYYPCLRSEAAKALGNFNSMKAFLALKEGLEAEGFSYDERQIRIEAIRSLGRNGLESAAEVLIERLGSGYGDDEESAMCEALAKMGAQTIEPLVARLREADESKWYYVKNALRAVGPASAPFLISLLDGADDRLRDRVIQTLEAVGGPDACLALIRENYTPNSAQVNGAIRTMRGVPDGLKEPMIAVLEVIQNEHLRNRGRLTDRMNTAMIAYRALRAALEEVQAAPADEIE